MTLDESLFHTRFRFSALHAWYFRRRTRTDSMSSPSDLVRCGRRPVILGGPGRRALDRMNASGGRRSSL